MRYGNLLPTSAATHAHEARRVVATPTTTPARYARAHPAPANPENGRPIINGPWRNSNGRPTPRKNMHGLEFSACSWQPFHRAAVAIRCESGMLSAAAASGGCFSRAPTSRPRRPARRKASRNHHAICTTCWSCCCHSWLPSPPRHGCMCSGWPLSVPLPMLPLPKPSAGEWGACAPRDAVQQV